MESLTGKPELMKKMNISLIYKTLIDKHTATRAEISNATKISITTIRTLLEELLLSGEIIIQQLDESSGGRRAQRYALNTGRNLILSLYIEGNKAVYQVCDILGNLKEYSSSIIDSNHYFDCIVLLIKELQKKWNICIIGLGVPGIVVNGRYIVSDGGIHNWETNHLGEQIQAELNMTVLLENDLNAIVTGFGIHYAEQNKQCDLSKMNISYIHFNNDCCGSGMIVNGNVVHGARQFAGELGFLPLEKGEYLDNLLKGCKDSNMRIDYIARAVTVVNCVSNPSLIVVGGECFEMQDIHLDSVKLKLGEYIPDIMMPEILYSNSYEYDYLTGLTYLTLKALMPKLPLSLEKSKGE